MSFHEMCDVFPAGAVIFRRGDPGDFAYLIEQGEVAISVGMGTQARELARRGVGEVFGEMAIIDTGARAADATALSATRLRRITRDSLARRMDGADPMMRLVMNLLLERLRQTIGAIGTPQEPEGPALPTGFSCHKAVQELRLEDELAHAIAAGQLALHYQPIVDLHSLQPAGFEALVRWQHPQHGWMSPIAFVPLAERSGLIRDLTRWCLATALHDIGRFARIAPAGAAPHVAVNISGHDLVDPGFSPYLEGLLQAHPAAAPLLKIEVTESVFAENPDQARACLDQCRALGVSVAIDDFGTGYSSLSQLHSLPITTLKVDRSFVMRVETDPTSRKIVQTILRLARDLDIQTVAEGIEDVAALRLLTSMGVTYGQGYLFSRPLPHDAAAAWLTSWKSDQYQLEKS